ncbi:MAG: protein-export chaperone SecB [Alphaproteobacteria bacterium]|nr:protein-export chaperone SecB [Alphaproteobacteria bacterium]
MSDETAAPPAPEGQPQEAQPTLVVNAQYVKDLSFENPNAPSSLLQKGEPNVQVGVDTSAVQLEGQTFEVTLTVRAEGTAEDTTLFLVEAAYAGIFTLGEMPEEYVAPMLYVEAPRQLFPFARAVVAECVRDGGFPPLLIHPVDFMALFQQRAQQMQAEQDAAGDGSGDTPPNGNGEQKFEFEL